ncbi:MAG TPA: winged helix DNA-binding domain-containing protein [Actinomycetes bacterium]|nr:winged helix DNA-binding domain-containing protein [Actinomycetes bacterium]
MSPADGRAGPVARRTARRRLAAQLLGGRLATGPEHVADQLLAVQAQDPRGFRLAVRARSRGLTAADVDDALTRRRTLVVSWLNRGTLHLVTAADYWWLHDLTTPPVRAVNARRLRQLGVEATDLARGVDEVVAAVEEGPQTRAGLRDRLEAAGVPTAGQALVHVLMEAGLLGLVVRGPFVDGTDQAWVSPTGWLGPVPAAPDRDEALARLARRYLRGHGPAGDRDLARWAGLPLRDVRAGLSSIRAETEDLGDGLVDLADREPSASPPPPRLLGAFDPLLLGWVSREPVLGSNRDAVVSGGVFRPCALVDGRVVATWRLTRSQVDLTPLEPLGDDATSALARDGRDVVRFLGLPTS